MLVAKVLDKRGDPRFFEVRKVGSVMFDPRPGWVLLATPIGGRKQDIQLAHPDDTRFEWVRDFKNIATDQAARGQ